MKAEQMPASAEAVRKMFREALALHQKGDVAEAERLYAAILQILPDNFDALHLSGILALQTSRTSRGIELIRRAIAINGRVAAAHRNLAKALGESGNLEEAVDCYDRAVALEPDNAEAHHNRANALAELGRRKEALAGYDKATALNPRLAEAWLNRGVALVALKRPESALESYERALALTPADARLHVNRGLALLELRRVNDALAAFDRAISFDANYAQAHVSRGLTLMALGRTEAALGAYDRALSLSPYLPEVLCNRGNALKALKRYEEALASHERALAVDPHNASIHYNRGLVLMDLRRPEDALAAYDAAIALTPDYAEAYSNRGLALMELNCPEAALSSYDRALQLNPDMAEAHGNRGNTLTVLQRLSEAMTSFEQAIALQPDDPALRYNPGRLLADTNRLDEALASYDCAMAINPDLPGIEGDRLNTKLRICDWSDLDTESARLISSLRDGKPNAQPFAFLALPSLAEDQLRCASLWAASKFPVTEAPLWRRDGGAGKIRIAYVSADFRDHPVGYLIAGLIERHDRARFQIIGISSGVDDNSETRRRLVSAFDQFHDVRQLSDRDAAARIAGLGADIAIDLTGHTRSGRIGIFACRPAPVQANWLGYPGTMGTPAYDYIIADHVIAPAAHSPFFSERIVRLPDCYQPNDSTRAPTGQAAVEDAAGLPGGAFVFCCFNNNYKIAPRIFAVWMRILERVPRSVLWLLEDNRIASANLKREVAVRHIDPARLIFAPRAPRPVHMARHRCAGMFLDTLPYNAHTTASDALWAGLPVLTCLGETFAGRVGASVLGAIGLPELVTSTLDEYEALACSLALDPAKLAGIKAKLAANRTLAPLFDTARFTRNLESAYALMVERHRAGLPPDHITIL
jgi:predicted O-linked N-acetylglucosamine transferase (SPINDLY family)